VSSLSSLTALLCHLYLLSCKPYIYMSYNRRQSLSISMTKAAGCPGRSFSNLTSPILSNCLSLILRTLKTTSRRIMRIAPGDVIYHCMGRLPVSYLAVLGRQYCIQSTSQWRNIPRCSMHQSWLSAGVINGHKLLCCLRRGGGYHDSQSQDEDMIASTNQGK
jgi:hypothetical protein